MKPSEIRKGDVVRFTLKRDPRISVTSYAKESYRPGVRASVSDALGVRLAFEDYDLELVDRPLPPISEELVRAVSDVYENTSAMDDADLKAVINLVREYDRTHNKENA